MNTIRQSQILTLLISSLLGSVAYAQEPQHTGILDTAKIEQLTGAKGKLDTAACSEICSKT